MYYKNDVLEMLVFELREQFKGSCAIILTTEDGLYSEFYANREVVDFIKFRVQEYYPDFHFVNSLRNAKYPDYPSDVRENLDKRLKDFIGFSCNKELIDYLKIHVPYRADFVIFSATKCAPTRTYTTPQTNAFSYDPVDGTLTVCSASGIYIRMNPYDVIEFMYSIQKITNNRYKPYDGVTANNPEDLRKQLVKENYVKMPGPINCEVWGCFSDSIENLLMLEIIYPYTGSRHINVALDLNLYKTTLSV